MLQNLNEEMIFIFLSQNYMSLLGHANTALSSYTHLLGYSHLDVRRALRIPVLSVAEASSEIAVRTMNTATWFI